MNDGGRDKVSNRARRPKKRKRKVVSSVTILVVREKFMSCKLYVHSSRAVSHGVNISYQFVVADVTTLG